MVDVREIQERAAGSEAIGEIVNRFMRLECAQAATVRVMPWLLQDKPLFPPWRHFPYPWFDGDIGNLPPFFWETDIGAGLASYGDDAATTMSEIDRRFRDGHGIPMTSRKYREPLHLTLHVDRTRVGENEPEMLQSLARSAAIFTTVEKRPPMRLQFSGGDQVICGANKGTIGGFVDDGSGSVFGVTCAHVANSGRVDDLAGNQIGISSSATSATIMVAGSVCTPFPPLGAVGAAVNSQDFALVKMAAGPRGSGLKMASALRQTDAIDVDAHRARLRFNVRSLCIAMTLTVAGSDYCYAPLVELYSPAGTTWPGDSGAWGLRHQQTEWAAMVVGADGISTFAFDARHVGQWISNSGVSAFASGWSVY